MIKLYKNLQQIDTFFGSDDYQRLIENYVLQDDYTIKLMEDVVLYDDTISFFTNLKEYDRCYNECCKLLNLLTIKVSDKYKPV